MKIRRTIFSRQYALILSLMFILAVGLRIFRLGDHGIWFDEAFTWGTTQLPIMNIIKLPLQDPHPPLYYLLLKGVLSIFPQTEAGLRSLSAVCSLVGLVAVVFFASRWWNSKAGLFAGILFTLSSFDIYFAQEARMYTLLALLWFLSYAFLVEAAQLRSRLLLVWAIMNILMGYTHVYGLAISYIYMGVLVGLWCWHRLHQRTFFYESRWFWTSVLFSFICTLPILLLIISSRDNQPGSTWVPGTTDLLVLFTLITSGITSARHLFLDSDHLTIPVLAAVPLEFWLATGLLIAGCVFYALREDWRTGRINKLRAGLAVPSFVLPILLYIYLTITQNKLWFLRPYLGVAYIFYMWAGAGIRRTTTPFHYIIITVIFATAAASLVPYYTTWQKSNAKAAFQNPAKFQEKNLILIHPAYMSPIAYFYLPSGVNLWGISSTDTQRSTPIKITPNGILHNQYSPSRCSETEIQSAKTVYVYGKNPMIQADWENWPPCFTKKPLYIFEDNQWVPLKP